MRKSDAGARAGLISCLVHNLLRFGFRIVGRRPPIADMTPSMARRSGSVTTVEVPLEDWDLIFSAVASSTLAFVWSLLCHAALPIIVVAFHTSIANAPVHRSFASWCRQRCGWNWRGAISGHMKVSFQAARSIG